MLSLVYRSGIGSCSRMTDLLSIRDLNITFSTPAGKAPAVRGLSVSIAEGETLGLVGESGSGKSVTSLAIMRLLAPQANITGSIRFKGEELLTLNEEAMRAHRGSSMAMIFQEPMTSLNPVMRIGDQIAEALRAHGVPRFIKDAMQQWSRNLELGEAPPPFP